MDFPLLFPLIDVAFTQVGDVEEVEVLVDLAVERHHEKAYRWAGPPRAACQRHARLLPTPSIPKERTITAGPRARARIPARERASPEYPPATYTAESYNRGLTAESYHHWPTRPLLPLTRAPWGYDTPLLRRGARDESRTYKPSSRKNATHPQEQNEIKEWRGEMQRRK